VNGAISRQFPKEWCVVLNGVRRNDCNFFHVFNFKTIALTDNSCVDLCDAAGTFMGSLVFRGKGTPEKLLALHEKRKGELTAKFGKTIPVKLEPKEVAVQAERFIERTIG